VLFSFLDKDKIESK